MSRRHGSPPSVEARPGSKEALEAAWLSGDIDATHVSALVAAHSPATAEALARDEQMLVAQATSLRHDVHRGCPAGRRTA